MNTLLLALQNILTPQGGWSLEFLTRVVLSVVLLYALVVFIASFAFSLGPVVWTVINEVFPTRVRGRAVSFATAVNWGAAFLVSQFFLTLIDDIGTSATFFVFAGVAVVSFLWIQRRVPETKGRSLEEIEHLWDTEDPVADQRAAGEI